MESVVTRIQPLDLKSAVVRSQLQLELESAVGRSQPQLVSSHRNSSQPQDRISRSSYPAAGIWVNRRIESAATRIRRVSEIDISVGILDFSKYNYVYLFAFDNF